MRISPASYHHLLPRAFQPPATPHPGSGDEITLDALIAAYPEFRFRQHACPRDRRVRWELVRKNGADPGLYALITASLGELLAALDHAQPPQPAP